MSRLTISLFVALFAAAVSGGEASRSLAALRDAGSWAATAVAAISGLVLFASLAVLARIAFAISRSQRRGDCGRPANFGNDSEQPGHAHNQGGKQDAHSTIS